MCIRIELIFYVISFCRDVVTGTTNNSTSLTSNLTQFKMLNSVIGNQFSMCKEQSSESDDSDDSDVDQ